MKPLYKTVRVIYNAHEESYDIQYKNWFIWQHDRSYKFDIDSKHTVYYRTKEDAKEAALKRANSLLNTIEIFRGYV
jgi:hypothetical protein